MRRVRGSSIESCTMDSNFPDSVLPRVRSVVQTALPCPAAPVQMALAALLADDAEPMRAMIACSLHDSEGTVQLGSALDLIDIGLRRLHAQVDDPSEMAALLGTAGNVLAGDYLTSGSFKLLVRCGDVQMLTRIADAITRTCEIVIQDGIDAAAGRQRDPTASAAPLGEVAGRCAAVLAGYPDAMAAVAGLLGSRLVACHVLLRRVRRDREEAGAPRTPPDPRLAEAARLCAEAAVHAEALQAGTGNPRPVVLTAWMRERIDAAR